MINPLKPRRFGIEIEMSRHLTCVNYESRKYSQAYQDVRNGLNNLHNLGKINGGWTTKVDISCGSEVVSPILNGPNGLEQITHVCKLILDISKKYNKPPVDAECGLHLHFDAADMSAKQISNLFILLHKAEPIIYSMYPYRSREYCAPIELNMRLASRFRDWIDVRDAWYRGSNNVKDRSHQYDTNFINSTRPGDHYDGTRYHGFNIHCYWRQGSVEFRYASGTIDPLHIRAYYEMCLSMVNSAISGIDFSLDEQAKTLQFDKLLNFYGQNFRFRKHIRTLCKECNFSRNTIKLIMEMISLNNPMLLEKQPGPDVMVINSSNFNRFFYQLPDGRLLNSRGEILSSDGISKSRIVKVKPNFDINRMSSSGLYPVVSADRTKFVISCDVFLPCLQNA